MSEFGVQLDTAPDFVMLAFGFVKLYLLLTPEPWLSGWIGVIAVIKGINLILSYILIRKWITLHSKPNKAVGILLFFLPFLMPFLEGKLPAVIVCCIATIAAIQKGQIIRTKTNSTR